SGGKLRLTSTYKPYVRSGSAEDYLPAFVTDSLRAGFARFDRQIPGFIQNGLLVGAETRTSSPVRILRDKEGKSISLAGLYPAGEGAGYAGGIVSAAVDGLKAAESILAAHSGWQV
ncbi:MAG: hypothetical protein IJP03_01550, partial [Christensenellaceae bacterium]|nr:hypothetical protein [Christensenellaceae bacterium]